MEIHIENDERCRIGGKYPYCVDVFKAGLGQAYGFSFHQFTSRIEGSLKIVELRKKEESYALFMREFEDQELPEWWQSSEVVWCSNNVLQPTPERG